MSELVVNTVYADRWDREDLKRIINEMPTFRAARKALGAFTPTGKEALEDTFQALHRAIPILRNPDEISPSYRVNRAVMQAVATLPEAEHLRSYTVGDEVQAAMACVDIEPDLETLFDRLALQFEKAKQLEELLARLAQTRQEATDMGQDLDEMLERWVAAGGTDAGANQDLDDLVRGLAAAENLARELVDQVAELSDELDASIKAKMMTLTSMVRDALERGNSSRAELEAEAMAWGIEPGELQRMPVKARLDLARKLNSPRMRDIARIFGRIRTMVMSDYVRTTDAPHEIYDLEFGNDLSRLAPSELLYLCNSATEDEFLRRFSERLLLQYSMQGEDALGRGGIIFCEDGSGSMSGERELWAKAVMLMLLNLAKEQRRPMHVLHFGSPGQIKIFDFVEPTDFTFDRIVEAAELFWAGGTDFVTPMQHALDILVAEHIATGAVRADVVFITDDECWVPDEFMESYLAEMHRMQATTWGIATNHYKPHPTGALYRMCEGKVAVVRDFVDGTDVRDVFRGAA